jgi:tRNA(Ile)-lysidine synthase
MLAVLQEVLWEKCFLLPDQTVLIGVSGGADSLCLLDILTGLQIPIVVAHLDHGLRPQAATEARFVRGVAETLGLPFAHAALDTAGFASRHSLSIEEAARELRYRFLFEQAENYKAQAVAVAHHADDQVETVVMHLLRGAGLDGLVGMAYRSLPNPWSATIPLLRPLLGIWRAEIEAYCAGRGLQPLTDQSNFDTAYFRNRLRHELIPTMENYVPGLRRRLWQTADLLAADRALLDQLSEQAWLQTVARAGAGFAAFHLPAFRLHPLVIQRRLIRRAVAQLRPGARDLDFALVQRALHFAARPTLTGQVDLGLGLRAFLEEGNLWIAAWEADLPGAQWPQVFWEGYQGSGIEVRGAAGEIEIYLGNGWRFTAELLSEGAAALPEALGNCDPYQAWIDLGDRQPRLMLRPRYLGDRFQPLGMAGKSMKLSDFMINRKIPRRARAGWPLVCVGDEIAWLPGYGLAHPFRLSGDSKSVVRLSLRR